ncbi:MAG: phosphotransferase [Verrucomicrobiae bacterium]|nr:phosphotransferase [Verrucomicrobiae bacterium]MCP5539838.1 phosphotransferase [Akkermansiaceae bacterium]MCP5551939.1 phosphotransferase [Akkermansiaceae bacterium]
MLSPSENADPAVAIWLPRLREAGLVAEGGEISLEPLAGGVSSDIVRVRTRDGHSMIVKAALPKLRVKDDWFADVSRNRVERAYFEYAASVAPDSVPRILGGGDDWFAMEDLGGDLRDWKADLIAGNLDPEPARRAGEVLGKLHARSWGDPVARERFDTVKNFHALRVESYLLTTADRVPEAAERLREEAARLAASKIALVHGDYSPKNLLIGPGRLVVLDAECGWFGDPAFDTAFLLTHLHLKALLHPGALDLVPIFWRAHSAACGHDIEAGTVRLLLCLLLARVHGKSPAEYLDESRRAFVTRFVLAHLPKPPSLDELGAAWRNGS